MLLALLALWFLGCGHLLGQDLLDALLLLDQEGSHNAIAHTLAREATTVGAGDTSVALWNTTSIGWSSGRDAVQDAAAITASGLFRQLLLDQGCQSVARSAEYLELVGFGVVRAMAAVSQTLNHLGENRLRKVRPNRIED